MSVSLPLLAIAGLAFLLAGFVKGVLGQGLPTVAIGVLALVMSPGEATALLILPALTTNVWQALDGPAFGPLVRRLWPAMVAICLGTWVAAALGLALLTPEAAALARKALGLALIAYGVLGLARLEFPVPPRMEWWLGPLMGVANGVVSTATGTFMVPIIPYIQSLGLKRDDLVQAQGISFSVSTLALTPVLFGIGTLNTGNIAGSALAVIAAAAGMLGGQWVRHRVQPAVFRVVFFLGMLALGIHLALVHK